MLDWNTVIRLANEGTPEPDRVVRKSDEEWRAQLSDEQYRVTRKKGTERPFSSEMCSLFEPGLYRCVCCDTLLFDAGEKFESGTGWPSFTQPVKPNAVAYHADHSHGMTRIETTCNSCGAHLGHVFPDGPPPTGLRYCINAVALLTNRSVILETGIEMTVVTKRFVLGLAAATQGGPESHTWHIGGSVVNVDVTANEVGSVVSDCDGIFVIRFLNHRGFLCLKR